MASPPPKWVKPQLTRLVDEAPGGDGWLHEIKHDGYRTHARIDGRHRNFRVVACGMGGRPDDLMPKSSTRTYEVIGNTEKLTGSVVTADGKTIPLGFTATLDGKDSPSQNPGVDTLVITPDDALRVLSKDGKVMTLTTKGLNPAGKPVESTMVFDRR